MITNEQRDDLLQYYDATGILKKEIRSYEVSLWTLQDEFITVLKWSDAEHKGRIENPTMTLNVDGTQNFECSIPMYIDYKGKIIENPNWYHTLNENIIMDLRKIKVILNKGTDNEAVFEFIIVEVTESHENSILTCNIKCEGLAFHELGKIGYKINLSEDTFYDAYEEWENEENRLAADEPIENIDFWMGENGLKLEKAQANLNPTKWYYKVDMNWVSFKDGSLRDRSKIYEEPYASDWDEDLKPIATENYKEKLRPISVENSNIYNITLTIAETFLVYCRYEYGYDENYHINSRTIIFYNNFLCEDNPLSLTYPYSSTKVSRTMDSNDLTTKLYVLSVENANNLDGFNSIMNTKANKTKEDYILNFDYLYKTNGITEELYKRINEFEIEIRDKNKELVPLQNIYNKLSTEKVEIEGKKTFYENSVTAAQELITTNSALINNLVSTHGNGYSVEKDEKNPDYLPVLESEDGKSVNLTYTNKGIKSESILIYTSYDSINSALSNEITDFIIIFDEYNCPAEIRFKTLPAGTSMIYLTYEYVPQLYYDSIVKIWEDKMAQDSILKDLYTAKLTSITLQIENVKSDIDTKIKEKEELIADFEHMMGPALREGYWQPEDYKDYGSKYNVPKDFNGSSVVDAVDENDYALIWDDKLFDTELDISYKLGVDLNVKYYPCINLNTVFSNNIPSNIDEYSFIFNNTFTKPTLSNALIKSPVNYIRTFKIDKNGGGEAVLCYIKNSSNVIIPCLLLVGAKTMTDGTIDLNNNEIAYMKNSQLGHPTIGTYTATVDDETKAINVIIDNEHSVGAGAWITLDDTYHMVYPRIQFTSSNYEGNNTLVYYLGLKLERYEDYLPLTRLNDSGVLESLITIKPKIMYAALNYNGHVEVHYTISNANTQIYLDAIAVSKENAWPKVSYEVTPSIMNKDIVRTLYEHVAQLVMINDTLLKLTNTFGYISGMTLDLDNPLNDTLEIKNYKTKFEDLFSNIVALTEAMKTNEGRFYAAMEGEIPLSSDALSSVLSTNVSTFNIMLEYLDSYFDSSQVVLDRLTELFTEAGEILTDSGQALSRIRSLTTENASILAGFAQNIAGELTVKVTKSPEKPQGFKVGDIWILTDASGNEVARYVATYNASEMEGNTNNPSSGFVRTYDGTLSSITGAGMDIDTVEGLVDIYGLHEIKIRSGEHVYIGADDTVDIVGNNYVNIGGGTINIAGEANTNSGTAGGINIVSSGISIANSIENMKSYTNWESAHDYQVGDWVKQGTKYYRCKIRHTSGNSFVSTNWAEGTTETIEHQMNTAIANTDGTISKVLIHPDKIEMGSSNILMRGANVILMVTSTGTSSNTSAIEISPSTGVWIGSGLGVRLFSGGFSYNASNNTLTKTAASGASVELNAEHLILGYANTKTNSSTAIEMTESYMIIATGSSLSGDSNDSSLSVTGATGGLVGAKFTKDSIGMAVSSGNTITAFLMDENGFTVGSGGLNITLADLRAGSNNSVSNGSYTRISKEGIELGSFADLYINTNNFKLLTHSRDKGNNQDFTEGETVMALGNNLQSIGYYSIYDATLFSGEGGFKDSRNNTVIGTTNNRPDVRLLVNKNGVYIKGTIYASAGSFTGSVTSSEFVAIGSTGRFIANGSGFGLYTNDTTPAGILTFTSGKMSIASNYTIEAGGGLSIATNQNFSVSSGGVIIDTTATGTPANPGVIFSVSGTNGSLTLDTNGDLTISGNITATNSAFSGTVTSSLFKAIGSNGLFIADSTKFGLYTLGDSPSPILTFSTDANNTTYMDISGNYVIKASGGITIDADKDFIMSANNGCFIIDSSIPKLYIADNASWSTAQKGIQYTANGGLEIKGNISANSITTGTLSGIDLDIGNTNGQHLTYNTLTAALTINGHIEAATGTIGPFTITSDGFRVTGNNNALLKYDTTNSVFLLSLGNSMIRTTSSYCDLSNAPNSVMVRAANSGTYGVQITGLSGGCYMVGSGSASLTLESTAWELGSSSGAYVGCLTGVSQSLGELALTNLTGNVIIGASQTITFSLYNAGGSGSSTFTFNSTAIAALSSLVNNTIRTGLYGVIFSSGTTEVNLTLDEIAALKALVAE